MLGRLHGRRCRDPSVKEQHATREERKQAGPKAESAAWTRRENASISSSHVKRHHTVPDAWIRGYQHNTHMLIPSTAKCATSLPLHFKCRA